MKKNEKTYEQLIKLGAMSDPSQVKDILTDEEVMELGYSLPPEDMLDKIKKACEEEKTAENPPSTTKSKKHNIRRIILIAAILIVIIGAISATGVRQYSLHTRETFEDNTIRFSGTNDTSYKSSPEETDAYENADDYLGVDILRPTYMPDGFKFSKIRLHEHTRVIVIYKNQAAGEIRFTQQLTQDNPSNNRIFDTKEGNSYTLNAHNTIINISEHIQEDTNIPWLSAVWYSDKLMHKVDSNCSREEFNMFIENLE